MLERFGEDKIFIYLLVFLFVWFYWGVDYFAPFISNNFVKAYALFTLAYSYFAFKYVLELGNPLLEPKFFSSYYITLLLSDLLLYPYTVAKTGIVQAPINTLFSSEVFIYNLLPRYSPLAMYILVYVVVPVIGLKLARVLSGRKHTDILRGMV